ncbi:MAG: histidinol phosphate phosphatase [Actinobacteria bacterium]|nr:histidinol phosphate phosphatase [Actinomycetota bacterium]
MLTDYHLHLQPDGPEAREADRHRWDADGGPRTAAWIGRYVDAARARAVDEIAITEHVHRFAEVRDWHPNPWWQAEATEDLGAHCAALSAARDAGLPVLIGIEMDWIPGREDDIRALLASQPFDIVLGSVHWLGDLAVDHPDYPCWDSLGPDETWGLYLDELVAAARSGLFDVLAHPDLPKVFGTPMPTSLGARRDDAIAAIAESGVAVECSSAGLRKPCAALYPDPDWLAALRAAGVPVTLSSDAHRPEDVARDYPTAVAALRGAGYETITRFRSREPEQVEIRWA